MEPNATKRDDPPVKHVTIWWFIGALVFVFVLWLGFGLGPIYFGKDLAKSGQFGDTFGAVNSLFSGLAFTAVVYAILLQREDLKITVHEFRRSVEAQE